MKRKRYTEEQIIDILKAHEAGADVASPLLCGRHLTTLNNNGSK